MSNFLAEPQHLIGHSTARFRIVQRGGNFRAESVASPGFCNRGESEVWVCRVSRVRSPPVPVVLSVYQRGSLLYGLAMYFSCDTKKFHGNESTHILDNFWTSTHRGEASPLPPGGATGRSNTRGGSVAEWLACWTQRHFLTPICTDGLSAWVELAALPQTPQLYLGDLLVKGW